MTERLILQQPHKPSFHQKPLKDERIAIFRKQWEKKKWHMCSADRADQRWLPITSKASESSKLIHEGGLALSACLLQPAVLEPDGDRIAELLIVFGWNSFQYLFGPRNKQRAAVRHGDLDQSMSQQLLTQDPVSPSVHGLFSLLLLQHTSCFVTLRTRKFLFLALSFFRQDILARGCRLHSCCVKVFGHSLSFNLNMSFTLTLNRLRTSQINLTTPFVNFHNYFLTNAVIGHLSQLSSNYGMHSKVVHPVRQLFT